MGEWVYLEPLTSLKNLGTTDIDDHYFYLPQFLSYTHILGGGILISENVEQLLYSDFPGTV